MSDTILSFFDSDEQEVFSEIDKEILEKLQNLPAELVVDDERMGDVK